MLILGIDPGATTGWCAYDAVRRSAVASGCFPRDEVPHGWPPDIVVIERPVAHGPTRPEVVECARIEGMLFERFSGVKPTHELTRLQVRQRLQAALHGTIRVFNDSTVWAAVVQLHGGAAAAKIAFPKVKSHARAALAVAVAWTLPQP